MGASGRWGRRRGAVTSLSVVAFLVTSSVVFGHANSCALHRARLESVNAVENDSNNQAQPNLCEGINGIPFGGDPGWVRTNGSPDLNTLFVRFALQVLPDLNYKTNPFVTHTDAVQPLQPRHQRVRDAR